MDFLTIGGHTFRSRFILGSGKFSLEMTKAVVENGGVEMATLALRRANTAGRRIFSTTCPRASPCCPTSRARAQRRERCGLRGSRGSSAVGFCQGGGGAGQQVPSARQCDDGSGN